MLSKLHSFLDNKFAGPAPLQQQELFRLEQAFKRKLSNTCHELGITDWKGLVNLIFKWIAQATGEERLRRHHAIRDLMTQIDHCTSSVSDSHRLPNAAQRAEAAKQVLQLLLSFVEKLPADKQPRWLARLRASSS